MNTRPQAGRNGPTYPHSHDVYLHLLIKRVDLRKRLIDLKAPACIKAVQNKLVLEALVGIVFPSIINYLRRRDDQVFLDSLCAKESGWSYCKRQRGHDGDCEYDWSRAADLMENEGGDT